MRQMAFVGVSELAVDFALEFWDVSRGRAWRCMEGGDPGSPSDVMRGRGGHRAVKLLRPAAPWERGDANEGMVVMVIAVAVGMVGMGEMGGVGGWTIMGFRVR